MLRTQMDAVLMSPIGFERLWGSDTDASRIPRPEIQGFSLSSESFPDSGVIPEHLAGEDGVSPQLSWMNEPEDTNRFVIIMDDPDARQAVGHTFVHWVAALPARRHSVEEGVSTGGWTEQHQVLSGNSTSTAYRGPRPPWGTHRYYITVYAMGPSFEDPEFDDLAGSELANDTRTFTRERFESLYRDDIKALAEITGIYTNKTQH